MRSFSNAHVFQWVISPFIIHHLLSREREQLATANEEIDRLQSLNTELESELLTCRQKEAELLAFTQKLTDKNVQIQSQLSSLQSKARSC